MKRDETYQFRNQAPVGERRPRLCGHPLGEPSGLLSGLLRGLQRGGSLANPAVGVLDDFG